MSQVEQFKFELPIFSLSEVSFEYQVNNKKFSISQKLINYFLAYLVQNGKLSIYSYFEQITIDPFFIVASTGLGKTVTLPVLVLLRLIERNQDLITKYSQNNFFKCDHSKGPKVFVVVPTIPIATDEALHLNESFHKFLHECLVNEKKKTGYKPEFTDTESLQEELKLYGQLPPYLFGYKTGNGSIFNNAPIQFITTGVFEAMSYNKSFDPIWNHIIIDEAHKTLETSESFELALSLAKYNKIGISYMSATVHTEGLAKNLSLDEKNVIMANKVRFQIWKHNTQDLIKNSLVNIIQNTLFSPDFQSEYFPQSNSDFAYITKKITFDWEDRSSVLLAIVNNQSEIDGLANLIQSRFEGKIQVLKFTSKVKKNHILSKKFYQSCEELNNSHARYVILATNVVEMGVTIRNLDFLVTVDSEYKNEDNGLNLVPLKVNALYQRIGRVGRQREGIAFITNDIGADYSTLDDNTLNQSLKNEIIDFLMSKSSLTTLAFLSFELGFDNENLVDDLKKLDPPSKIYESEERIQQFIQERNKLRKLGLINENGECSQKRPILNQIGKYMMTINGYTNLDLWLQTIIFDAYKKEDSERLSFWLSYNVFSQIAISEILELLQEKKQQPFLELNPETQKFYFKDEFVYSGEDGESISVPISKISSTITIYNLVVKILEIRLNEDFPLNSELQEKMDFWMKNIKFLANSFNEACYKLKISKNTPIFTTDQSQSKSFLIDKLNLLSVKDSQIKDDLKLIPNLVNISSQGKYLKEDGTLEQDNLFCLNNEINWICNLNSDNQTKEISLSPQIDYLIMALYSLDSIQAQLTEKKTRNGSINYTISNLINLSSKVVEAVPQQKVERKISDIPKSIDISKKSTEKEPHLKDNSRIVSDKQKDINFVEKSTERKSSRKSGIKKSRFNLKPAFILSISLLVVIFLIILGIFITKDGDPNKKNPNSDPHNQSESK